MHLSGRTDPLHAIRIPKDDGDEAIAEHDRLILHRHGVAVLKGQYPTATDLFRRLPNSAEAASNSTKRIGSAAIARPAHDEKGLGVVHDAQWATTVTWRSKTVGDDLENATIGVSADNVLVAGRAAKRNSTNEPRTVEEKPAASNPILNQTRIASHFMHAHRPSVLSGSISLPAEIAQLISREIGDE